MTDTPKFTVVDRRKFKEGAEETASTPVVQETPSNVTTMPVPETPRPAAEPAPEAKPRLTLVEPPAKSGAALDEPTGIFADGHNANDSGAEGSADGVYDEMDLPGAPTAEELRHQKMAYDTAAERIDDLIRAQNPGAPPIEKVGFEHLVQQLYLSALMQMGAGTPEGQRPRVDILGARQTIDLVAILSEKTRGNLSADEERAIQAVLFELRMTFLEITRAVASAASGPLPPPPGGKF